MEYKKTESIDVGFNKILLTETIPSIASAFENLNCGMVDGLSDMFTSEEKELYLKHKANRIKEVLNNFIDSQIETYVKLLQTEE